MKLKKIILPLIILAVTVLLIASWAVFDGIAMKPVTEKADFPYSITYTYNGETKTVEGVYSCSFIGADESVDPADRFYSFKLSETEGEMFGGSYVIEEEGNAGLYINLNLDAGYMMGDEKYADAYDDGEYPFGPYVVYYDEQGVEYRDEATLSRFDLEIESWEYAEPIENSLVFSHITRLTADTVTPMTLIALAGLLCCIIFVRKDEDYKKDTVSIVSMALNFIIGIPCVPFVTVACVLSDINGGGTEPIFQLIYSLPAITVLCYGASVCLRRKGMGVASLIVQFVGPLMFCVIFGIEFISMFFA